jgi:SAM-dependent methyltransferase
MNRAIVHECGGTYSNWPPDNTGGQILYDYETVKIYNMIDLYKKLSRENLIQTPGNILDLGSGNGVRDLPFIEAGYSMTLVDKSVRAIAEAKEKISDTSKITFIESDIETFEITEGYDGIIAMNSLPFLKNEDLVIKVVNDSFNKLRKGGFLHFSLFGPEDEWYGDENLRLTFFSLEKALTILPDKPYFVSEDKGIGGMMKGGTKWWHIIHLLYIKK